MFSQKVLVEIFDDSLGESFWLILIDYRLFSCLSNKIGKSVTAVIQGHTYPNEELLRLWPMVLLITF